MDERFIQAMYGRERAMNAILLLSLLLGLALLCLLQRSRPSFLGLS